MDKKQTWLLMTITCVVMFAWMLVIRPYLLRKYNWSDSPQQSGAPAENAASSGASTGPTTGASSTTGPTSMPVVAGAAEPTAEPIILGHIELDETGSNPYPLGLSLDPRGAALESATLNRFRLFVDQTKPYRFQEPYDHKSAATAALATRSVSIDGGPSIALDSVYWRHDPPTDHSVRFWVEVSGILRIAKTYEIRPAEDKTAGYEVLVSYALENLAGRPLKAKLEFNSTNSPGSENSRDYPELVAGFDGGRQNVAVEHKMLTSIGSEGPLDVKGLKSGANLLWDGMTSAYFDALVRPATELGAPPSTLASVKATALNPNAKDVARQVVLSNQTADIDVPVAGGTSVSLPLSVYLGPKSRDILDTTYYASFPRSYDETLVLRGGLCSICTFTKLINVLVWLLQMFHTILRDWGLAIIALVVLVRLILHPITKRSQISMSRMTKMGPEMERLKAKHKDDPEALKKAQMEFYREQGIAPFLGCLPMFLQMPIWIALWSSLQSTFEIRHAPFLRFGLHLTWIKDLSQPDRLIPLAQRVGFTIPFIRAEVSIDAINILPILMAATFYIQQKFQPQPVSMTPEQAQQQKLMKWMSIFLFPIFLYSQPSGLNLYIFTSTLIGIFESKRIRDHIKEREEREKAGIVIVDAPKGDGKPDRPATGTVRRSGGGGKGAQQAAPTGGIGGFFAKLQQMAEEAKAEQEKRAKKGKR
jgi:YidC/Oxa1 family membrane protein insertase